MHNAKHILQVAGASCNPSLKIGYEALLINLRFAAMDRRKLYKRKRRSGRSKERISARYHGSYGKNGTYLFIHK